MAGENFINLDRLRAEGKRGVQFLGKKFDMSFIPCGLSIPLLEAHNAEVERERKLAEAGKSLSTREMLENELHAVSLFCSFYYKEFTKEFLSRNATDKELMSMYLEIVRAIVDSFGVGNAGEASDEEAAGDKKKPTSAS